MGPLCKCRFHHLCLFRMCHLDLNEDRQSADDVRTAEDESESNSDEYDEPDPGPVSMQPEPEPVPPPNPVMNRPDVRQ